MDNKNVKYLCLVDDADLYEDSNSFSVCSIYKKVSRLFRVLRHIHNKCRILSSFKYIWLDDWKKNVAQYEKIIIFDSIFDYYPLEYIRKHNPKCIIIFCFRNRVSDYIKHAFVNRDPILIRKRFNADLYSYNREDCKKYEMNYYNQFHIIPSNYKCSNYTIDNDIFFIGNDKGRMKCLLELSEIYTNNNIKYLFMVIPDAEVIYSEKEKRFLSEYKSYKEILDICNNSRCILELITDINKGITYRTLEAIVLQKKLITNNIDIKDSELYDSDNMFVIGIDRNEDLMNFISSPYRKKDNSVLSFTQFCFHLFSNESN